MSRGLGRRRDLAVLAGIAVAFALLGRWVGEPGLEPPPLPPLASLAPPGERPQAAPFRLPDLQGQLRELAELRGRVVLLNFWATWCGPCRQELPALQALHDRLSARGLQVLGLSVDAGDPVRVARFLAERSLSLPTLHDPSSRVADRYAVSGFPTTILVDRRGGLVHRELSAWDWAAPSSVAWLEQLLAEPAPQ